MHGKTCKTGITYYGLAINPRVGHTGTRHKNLSCTILNNGCRVKLRSNRKGRHLLNENIIVTSHNGEQRQLGNEWIQTRVDNSLMMRSHLPVKTKSPSRKSHVRQFSRQLEGRGYLVAVTGSTWVLHGTLSCYGAGGPPFCSFSFLAKITLGGGGILRFGTDGGLNKKAVNTRSHL